MKVKVKYFGFFEDLTGRNEEIVGLTHDHFCIEELIHLLSEKYGAKFRNTLINSETKKLKEGYVLLLNEVKGYLDQGIKDGDVISLLPILAGG